MVFDWENEKNDFLQKQRNVSFEEIVLCISEGSIVDIIEHPNKEKYPKQKVYLVERENYIYAVPFIKDEDSDIIFLKTIFPSRKYTRKYLQNQEEKR
ncbi:MAG: toxin [Spirochaetia bacterium]|nr:toxin [Spirochaetia bacterium]